MIITIRPSSCHPEIGECTIRDGATNYAFDYDREDLAQEFINAYRDLFGTDSQAWVVHLSHYLGEDECKQLCSYELEQLEIRIEKMKEALHPFASEAPKYDPREGDDADPTWSTHYTLGDLRRAQDALEGK